MKPEYQETRRQSTKKKRKKKKGVVPCANSIAMPHWAAALTPGHNMAASHRQQTL